MTKNQKSALVGRHTPGEWIAVGFQVETDNGDPMVPDICTCAPLLFGQRDTRSHEEIKANARRIAACVNRLAGFKTDDIENPACDITGHGAMLSKLIYIEMQRDRLLAALNLIETGKDGDGFICREAMEQVREAIAQAEEGAGQ